MDIGTNDIKELALLFTMRIDEIENEIDNIINLFELEYINDEDYSTRIEKLEDEQQKIETAQSTLHDLECNIMDIEND